MFFFAREKLENRALFCLGREKGKGRIGGEGFLYMEVNLLFLGSDMSHFVALFNVKRSTKVNIKKTNGLTGKL